MRCGVSNEAPESIQSTNTTKTDFAFMHSNEAGRTNTERKKPYQYKLVFHKMIFNRIFKEVFHTQFSKISFISKNQQIS